MIRLFQICVLVQNGVINSHRLKVSYEIFLVLSQLQRSFIFNIIFSKVGPIVVINNGNGTYTQQTQQPVVHETVTRWETKVVHPVVHQVVQPVVQPVVHQTVIVGNQGRQPTYGGMYGGTMHGHGGTMHGGMYCYRCNQHVRIS